MKSKLLASIVAIATLAMLAIGTTTTVQAQTAAEPISINLTNPGTSGENAGWTVNGTTISIEQPGEYVINGTGNYTIDVSSTDGYTYGSTNPNVLDPRETRLSDLQITLETAQINGAINFKQKGVAQLLLKGNNSIENNNGNALSVVADAKLVILNAETTTEGTLTLTGGSPGYAINNAGILDLFQGTVNANNLLLTGGTIYNPTNDGRDNGLIAIYNEATAILTSFIGNGGFVTIQGNATVTGPNGANVDADPTSTARVAVQNGTGNIKLEPYSLGGLPFTITDPTTLSVAGVAGTQITVTGNTLVYGNLPGRPWWWWPYADRPGNGTGTEAAAPPANDPDEPNATVGFIKVGGKQVTAVTPITGGFTFTVPNELSLDQPHNIEFFYTGGGNSILPTVVGTYKPISLPSVTADASITTVSTVTTGTEANTYKFDVTPLVQLNNGKVIVKKGSTELDATTTTITAVSTENNGVYTITLGGVTESISDINVAYTGETTVQAGDKLTVTQPTAGANDTISFDATPNKADETGIFAFTYSVDGTVLTTNTPKATVGKLNTGTYTIKLSAPEGTTAIPGNLLVKVNYSIPAVDEPTVDEELPTITPDEISEENAGNAFILVGGKENDDKWTDSKIEPVVNSSKLVPGTTYTTKVTTTTTIAAGEKLTISFTGALATVVPPIEVEKPTQVINPGEIAVIFVFQSSEATELKTAKSKADPVTTSTSKAEFKNGILYIYLIGIKEDALGDTPSTAQINTTTEDGETTTTVAIINDEITLFTHPINLTINNTVPANNYTGSFTITGDYIEGSLYYRIGDEKYKVYPGSIPQSEIARLANGELLYLTLDKEDFNNVIVYVPNTFEGTSPSPIPQNRNVTVVLADGSPITTGLTSNEEFKFTFTPTVSYDDGTVELTFTRDGLPVQNPPTVEGTETPIDGTYNITLKNVKTSNLVVTLHYNTTTQIQIVTDNKVWTENNVLYIQTKNNGTATVYDVNGKIVKTVATKQGINNIHLNTGVYVVKTGKNVYKVVVK